MGELSNEQLRELLGAYALDAVDDDERREIERFLTGDPAARAELAEFRELAALMANLGTDAPVGVWNRIAATIDGDEPAPRSMPVAPIAPTAPTDEVGRRRQSRSLRVAAVVAAIAAAAAIVLGVRVNQQEHRINKLAGQVGRTTIRGQYDAALRQRGAQRVTLVSPSGAPGAEIVYLPDGTGFLNNDRLPALPPGRTYQLWALVGDAKTPTAISAGVLGADPHLAAFRYDGRVVAFAITDERAPGVVSSTQKPVATGALS